jgi:serine phosphatase RsbU (regulator of sigma subunit)
MFGKQRIKEHLQSMPRHPGTVIELMKQAVSNFVGDSEQSDDLTMLALQWKN